MAYRLQIRRRQVLPSQTPPIHQPLQEPCAQQVGAAEVVWQWTRACVELLVAVAVAVVVVAAAAVAVVVVVAVMVAAAG